MSAVAGTPQGPGEWILQSVGMEDDWLLMLSRKWPKVFPQELS